MASAELHIKDSFYFEVPKFLWPSQRHAIADFPDVWVKNDPQFQAWEADRLCSALEKLDPQHTSGMPPVATLRQSYDAWLHADHAHFGKPFDIYLAEQAERLHDQYLQWRGASPANQATYADWLTQPGPAAEPGAWFAKAQLDAGWRQQWQDACAQAGSIKEFQTSGVQWSPATMEAYNYHLSGKILIPQPFGQLRNLYQGESGFCVSKFMIIEAAVFVVLLVIFSRIGRRVASGEAPTGRFWNFFESMLVFVRDEIARKAIHSHAHHDDEHHGEAGHGEGHHGDGHHAAAHHGAGHHGAGHHGAGHHGAAHQGGGAGADHHGGGHVAAGHVAAGHGAAALHVAHNPHEEADRFVPLLWTIFFFILGCNLMGMLPWMGAPTSSWGATIALALITFLTGVICGSRRFGFLGFWANQVPSMGLPWALAIVLVPMIFLIEVMGLVIKHTVLSIRLLANMIAGHLVLLAILMLAFSVEGAASASWGVTGFFAVVGSAALSCLELFVAFLQAYVFTLLSALFINAAIHKH
ncbi:MAG: F0F1 ATP synthase subunit A [Pirellulales bacterium]